MRNPYFNLLRFVWQYGLPWRRTIIGYYVAYIVARSVKNLAPYAFGRAINLLQHFKPELFNEVIYWLIIGVSVILGF
jgi:ATP-binding cassette, subfamily B, bacterial